MKKGQYLHSTNLLNHFKGNEIPGKQIIKFQYKDFLFVIELEIINQIPTLSAIQGRKAVSTYFPVELWTNAIAINQTASRLFKSMGKTQSA